MFNCQLGMAVWGWRSTRVGSSWSGAAWALDMQLEHSPQVAALDSTGWLAELQLHIECACRAKVGPSLHARGIIRGKSQCGSPAQPPAAALSPPQPVQVNAPALRLPRQPLRRPHFECWGQQRKEQVIHPRGPALVRQQNLHPSGVGVEGVFERGCTLSQACLRSSTD